MNQEITTYINAAPEEQRKIMETLRDLIHQEVPAVVENFKWSRPVFSTDKDFAYFKTTKNYLTFGVSKFNKIKEYAHLLEGTGKDMRHLKIKKTEEIQPEIIRNWVREISK